MGFVSGEGQCRSLSRKEHRVDSRVGRHRIRMDGGAVIVLRLDARPLATSSAQRDVCFALLLRLLWHLWLWCCRRWLWRGCRATGLCPARAASIARLQGGRGDGQRCDRSWGPWAGHLRLETATSFCKSYSHAVRGGYRHGRNGCFFHIEGLWMAHPHLWV